MPLDVDLRGEDMDFTLAAQGRETTETFMHTYQASHLRPLAPVHLKMREMAGNIELSWIRRTRIGGDDWRGLDVPLGEETERYKVQFLDGDGVAQLEREVETQTLNIPRADLENTFGTPLPPISLNISQYSVAYGWGQH